MDADRLEIRLVSYNAWLLPGFSKSYEERRRQLPEALQMLKADVLCLQEVWMGKDQGLLADALKERLPHAHRLAGGLLLMSRYPIATAEFTRFADSKALPIRERVAGKGYLDAILTTPVGRLRIITSHLAAMPHEGSPRSQQLTELLAAVTGRTEDPIILAADLNMPALREAGPSKDWLRLRSARLRDVNPPLLAQDGHWSPGVPTWYRWPRRAGTAGHRRDYICLRDGKLGRLTCQAYRRGLNEVESALSDHDAQIADVTLVLPAADPQARPGATRDTPK